MLQPLVCKNSYVSLTFAEKNQPNTKSKHPTLNFILKESFDPLFTPRQTNPVEDQSFKYNASWKPKEILEMRCMGASFIVQTAPLKRWDLIWFYNHLVQLLCNELIWIHYRKRLQQSSYCPLSTEGMPKEAVHKKWQCCLYYR